MDSRGNLYVSEAGNHRIRLLQPQIPSITGVANAASNLSAASISPGEIIVLYGSSLAGSSVTINGIPAPLTYTSARRPRGLRRMR